jgi:hypothetical protein
LFGVRVDDATKSSIFAPSCFVQKPIVWSHLSNKQKDSKMGSDTHGTTLSDFCHESAWKESWLRAFTC